MKKPNDLEMKKRSAQIRKQHATVCIRRACKKYGSSSNPFVVLDSLDMTVPKGSIYGLLGASGCGKTTLLNCIVGRRRLNSGELWVLGGTPGSKESGAPGPRVGYMPQETALYGEFTISETLKFFGWIADMKNEDIEQRSAFLLDFLMLTDADRQVKNLSGGQQRRVSLAATLLHRPELLILDEPTVGVDPLLRANIWSHLVDITKDGGTTVIITTHYIDEARQAHKIGLMRGGYLLAEESPQRLIAQFNAQSLEDVFLKLSVIQNMGKRRRSSIAQGVTKSITVPSGVVNEGAFIDDEIPEISGEFGDNVSITSRGKRVSICADTVDDSLITADEEVPTTGNRSDRTKIFKWRHMKALVWKNFLWMWRNITVMIFIIGLPMAQVILFCLSIGHEPRGLSLSVFNEELDFPSEKCEFGPPDCNSSRLSCNYLGFLRNKSLNLEYFSTGEDAMDSVKRGKTWAALIIPSNFSDALRNRIEFGQSVDTWDLDSSKIYVHPDRSNENIDAFIKRNLYFSLESFLKSLLNSCGILPNVGQIPMRFEAPVYGEETTDFTDFEAPGIILTIIFFLSVALTSGALLLERNEGILERSLVNGITGAEVLFSHVITQFTVMLFQTILVLIFAFAIFELELNGNILWVALLTTLTGLCGICFGFTIACSCENEINATYMAMGSFMPIVMLCGIIWPIEGMYPLLKIASFFLPLTQSTESLRCILARGWGMDNRVVYEGFIATLIWITIFLTISILVMKFKKG